MINRWKELARFGVMHSMATSLFFWFWLVRNETMDSLHHHQLTLHKKESSSSGGMPYLMNITHPGKNRKTTLSLESCAICSHKSDGRLGKVTIFSDAPMTSLYITEWLIVSYTTKSGKKKGRYPIFYVKFAKFPMTAFKKNI